MAGEAQFPIGKLAQRAAFMTRPELVLVVAPERIFTCSMNARSLGKKARPDVCLGSREKRLALRRRSAPAAPAIGRQQSGLSRVDRGPVKVPDPGSTLRGVWGSRARSA